LFERAYACQDRGVREVASRLWLEDLLRSLLQACKKLSMVNVSKVAPVPAGAIQTNGRFVFRTHMQATTVCGLRSAGWQGQGRAVLGSKHARGAVAGTPEL